MPRDAVIENPVINSPFRQPGRHFRFDEEGITSDVVDGRRASSYFVPIASARKRGGQQTFETEWTSDRLEENPTINRVRERVGMWRQGGHRGVTPTTRRLLEFWSDSGRERPLFFCQIEALETAIYITEAAGKFGDDWIVNLLREESARHNPGLFRVAQKMATGTGKTVVMGMIIAWHTLNKAASPQDSRFTDRFLVVTPGITIRDRLRVLLPSDPNDYYRERDLVPADLREHLGRARIVITNFHGLQLRSKVGSVPKLTKQILPESSFQESPDEMVRRVCRELGTSSKQIVVLNDEAHHCYRRRLDDDAEDVKLKGEERKEADQREEEARVWISGLEAVNRKLGIKTVFDLSATPFFLRGSGYSEGTLFPWVVSDFSLIDAIESGVVKVPRVPVADDSMSGEGVTYRNLWVRISDELPKRGRRTAEDPGEPRLPAELEGALRTLYGNYEKAYRRWERSAGATNGASTPPVFIVVCSNTAVSKLVYDFIAGYEVETPAGEAVARPGELGIFSNAADGRWLARPNTILIDSRELESGEAMSRAFKEVAAGEIEEFKSEIRQRFPGRDPDDLTDEDLLREVMNTVGKPGRLGEHVKCVVSVSMLTEGWDANTVTHILGVRAFSTQLLCEQVVGRGLRRRSYTADEDGMFPPEYAEVYGVPFSFIPAAGSAPDPKPGPPLTHVRALEDRIASEIAFPRLVGYRYVLEGRLPEVAFADTDRLALSTQGLPTEVEVAPIVGESATHFLLDDLRGWRAQQIEFELSRRLAQRYFRDDAGFEKPWAFPALLRLVRRWMAECVTLKDKAFVQMLRIRRFEDDAIDKIYRAIVRAGTEQETRPVLEPVLRPFDPVGSTRYVDFDTTRPTYLTDPAKCHISHVVADTESWEQKMAQTLEDMDEVVSYVKNHNLGFTIPYTIDGQQRQYIPDFIVHLDDGHDDPLSLIVEVSGAQRRDKEAKVDTARTLWIPAVNAHGGFGRWEFVEITDPWNAQTTIRAFIQERRAA
ncbi:MAG: DEAD/DEAH box helicase family protein [Acidimicrobiia bacterium]|nr:DEAD/DEAH box helicase family protein [Acidimicrobiia bacterium]